MSSYKTRTASYIGRALGVSELLLNNLMTVLHATTDTTHLTKIPFLHLHSE